MDAELSPKPRKHRPIIRWALLSLILALVCAGGVTLLFLRAHGRDARCCKKGDIYLETGNPSLAFREYRSALAANPKYLPARVGVVRALTALRDFAGAEADLDKAVKYGLEESEAALLKARLLKEQARYDFAAAGETPSPAACDEVIAECVDPAIELAATWAPKVREPAAAYALLGDLYTLKAQITLVEMNLLWTEYRQFQEAGLAQPPAVRLPDIQTGNAAKGAEDDVFAAVQRIRQAENSAESAYAEALRRDPDDAHCRLAVAGYDIAAYVPRIAEAEAVLAPLMRLNPVPPEAQYTMALAEWYDGKIDPALERIRNLTSGHPGVAAYLLTEVEILIDADRWSEALPVAQELIRLEPKSLPALFHLGRALLHEDRAAEAVDYLQNIFMVPKLRWPQARLALAQALMKMHQTGQAVRAYKLVIEDCAATALADTARAEKELQEAQYQACLALARAEKEVGRPAATAYAARAFAIFPDRTEAFQIARDAYRSSNASPDMIESMIVLHANALNAMPGRSEAAAQFLQKEYAGLKNTPGRGTMVGLLLARQLADQGSYREAVAAYEEIRKDFPKAAAWELAQLHERLGQDAEARADYEGLLKSDPRDARAVNGLVALLVRTKDWDAARAVIERTAAETGSEQAWTSLMALYMRQGRLEDAVSTARDHAQKNPASAVAQAELAELLWQSGDLKGARTAFDLALTLAPDFLYANRRALLDIEEDHAADAVTLLRRVAEKMPSAFSRTDLAVALQAAGQTEEAADLLKGVSSAAEGPLNTLDAPRWYLAVLRAGEGDLPAAGAMNDRVAVKDYLGLPADRLQLLQHVAAAEEKVRRRAAAQLNLVIWLIAHHCPGTEQQAERAAQLLPGEPLPACWRIRLLDIEEKHDEAVKEYRDLIRAQPGFLLARTLLADSLHSHQQADEAVQLLEESLSVAKPDQAAWIQLRLGAFQEELGRLDQAIAGYRAAMPLPACAVQACNNLAWLYATRRNDPDSALPLARQAAKLAGNDPAILDTLGWVLYLKGENDEALQTLSKAKSGLPDLPTVRYHLGMALLKAGRSAEARTELQEALAISKDFPEAVDAAAKLHGI